MRKIGGDELSAMPPLLLKSIRIFISYSDKDRKAVGLLKKCLEEIGFEVFIAHEDIKPRSEWQDEIMRNLNRCDIFMPFLSKHFETSKWGDQETGIAIASRKAILPLQVDIPPYGFIGKIQSLKIVRNSNGKFNFYETAEKIATTIITDEKFKENMKEFAINSLISSRSFEEANTRVKLLEYFDFTDEEINRICSDVLNNNQVYGAYTAQTVLRRIIDKYQNAIKPGIHKEITKALTEGWSYMPPHVREMLKKDES